LKPGGPTRKTFLAELRQRITLAFGIGEFVNKVGDGIIGLFDDESFEKIFEQVVDVFLLEVLFDARLVGEFLFFVH
jgi:hypothetical protein